MCNLGVIVSSYSLVSILFTNEIITVLILDIEKITSLITKKKAPFREPFSIIPIKDYLVTTNLRLKLSPLAVVNFTLYAPDA